MGFFVDCLVASLANLDELATLYRIFQVMLAISSFCYELAPYSVARTTLSYFESLKEAALVSTSLEEVHITLQGDDFTLPLDFLLITIVH